MNKELQKVAERLRTQDNLSTEHPIFYLQKRVRDTGYETGLVGTRCWTNYEDVESIIYDDDPDFKEPDGKDWEEYGYVDRWETVMVALTQGGLDDYMLRNGHNVKSSAFRGETRVYVESLYRCQEMIAIREALMKGELK